MTARTKQTLALATIIKENDMSDFTTDWPPEVLRRPKTQDADRITVAAPATARRPAFYLTTDLDSGNEAQNLATGHGYNLEILYPREGLPITAAALFVALDELLLDAHGRRQYFSQLLKEKRPYPIIIVGFDFYLERPTVVRPGFMTAARLNDNRVWWALRAGHIDPPAYEDKDHKAA